MNKTLLRVALFAALFSPFTVLLPTVALADTVGPITFEPSTYVVGSINGQDGWLKTGTYDSNVTNTGIPAGFGMQSLQISDEITSGSFGDQTFAKPLTDSVGETAATAGSYTAGTKQTHFEMQFDIASVMESLQSGMHLSVSPDRGDGSRMSYLRFEDQADGINIFFDDVQGTVALGVDGCTTTVCGNFVETKIATLSRSAHTIKLTMDVVDGPANDVVKVYIDGNLVHTGTSWEDYYRYDPEASAEQSPRIVKTVEFRESGTANVADHGNGFLIDNFSMMSGATPSSPTNTTVVVHPADMALNISDVISAPTKWFFYNDETGSVDGTEGINNSIGSFVTGPSTPPLGVGSVQISVPNEGVLTHNARRNLATYQFSGTKLGNITTLKFSTYNPSAGNGGSVNRSAYLNFNVDFNGSDTWQKRLIFVPSQNGTVTQNNWKEWDAVQGGNAKYAYSGSTWPVTATGPDAGLSGISGDTLRTWNDLLADYPGIRMRVTDSWLGLRVGEPYPDGYTENLDKFVLGTASGVTTFDFDPAPPTGSINITKYDCPVGTAVTRSANGVGLTVPAGCVPSSGKTFGYVHGTQTDANAPYPELSAPLTAGGATDGSGILNISSLPATGRYLVVETNNSNQQLAAGDILGLYCQGDGDTSNNNDNQELTFVAADQTVQCVAYDKAPIMPQVHIYKYVDNALATDAGTNSAVFPMETTFKSPNLGSVVNVPFTLSPIGWGAIDGSYEASFVGSNAGADYEADELLNTSLVGASCDGAHTYSLVGYSTGDTLVAAEGGTKSLTPPAFTNLQSDKYMIVWNKTCPTTANITITKISNGGNGTFNFTSNIPGHASFSITTVNNTGSVSFNGITPGTYSVSEAVKSGWTQTDNTCTGLALAAGSDVLCTVTNTNNKLLGSIRGTKYEDRDGDGKLRDGDHHRLSGVTIYVDKNNNSVLDAGDISTVTDSHGLYVFTGLSAGTYVVREVPQAGWTQTYPASGSWTVVLSTGQNAKQKDFGNFKSGTISGMKFNDANANHKKDTGEVGLGGWTITLKGPHGFTASTVTDANGNYSFGNLSAGAYKLSETMQAGWRQTLHPNAVIVHSSSVVVNKDFGNTQKPKDGHGDRDNDDQYRD